MSHADSRFSSDPGTQDPFAQPNQGAQQTERHVGSRSNKGKLSAHAEAGPKDAHAAYSAESEDIPASSWRHKLAMSMAVSLPLVGFVTCIVLLWQVGWMGWLYLGLLVGGWLLTGLGITIGFHRMLAHRSFKTYSWMRAFWLGLGSLAVEGSPLSWAAVHRRHHAHSDKPGDPHSPHVHEGGWWNALKGVVHSHVGWLFTGYWCSLQTKKYVPDLLNDKIVVAMDRFYYVFVLMSLAIPTAIAGLVTMSWQGALLGLLWGGLARIFITHHITWSINSLCHIFGSRPFVSKDLSRNNLLCGLLAHGEGWHNNHHAFPSSARHGLEWWQFDLSWLIICGMQRLGLAWDVRTPSERSIRLKRADSLRDRK